MTNADNTFNRLKEILSIKSDKDLAVFLDLNSISNYKKRDYLPYNSIIEKAKLGKYHLDYVFLGVGNKAPSNAKFDLENINEFKNIIVSKKLAALLQDLIKYGNEDIYESIEAKIKTIKEISKG